jgi:ribose 1,5-bisphosphate isomerase
MFNKFRFNRIAKRIKDLKIQGATNVAKAALKAYSLYPNNVAKRVLMHLRPTEPMLFHVLDLADKMPKEKILDHFEEAQNKINKNIFKIIKNNSVIFTHCHSTNVVKALIYARKNGKNFQVYNTETRPLFQGRRTAKELTRAGIKVTNFVDSATGIALKGEQGMKKTNLVFLGADALLDDAIINKVGSGSISELAFMNKIPVYIIADSWKRSTKEITLEQRDFKEVWNPKTTRIHIKNPAFEAIHPMYVRAIISELGILKYGAFLKKTH